MNKLKINDLYKNIASVGFVIFFIKIVALFKERYVGQIFGISETLDIFYILILVPFFIQNVFIGSFKAVFIPNYIRLNNEDKVYFHNNLIILGIFFSLLLAIIFY